MRHAPHAAGPAGSPGVVGVAVLLVMAAALGFALLASADYLPHRLILIVRQ
jgi:hypothetical protein